MFAIVRFTKENDAPGIVSTKWTNEKENICFYPDVRTEDSKNKLLRAHISPEENWLRCPLRILRKFSTYNAARINLRRAEDTSSLESEYECKDKFRKRRKFMLNRQIDENSSAEENPNHWEVESYPQTPCSSINVSDSNDNIVPSTPDAVSSKASSYNQDDILAPLTLDAAISVATNSQANINPCLTSASFTNSYNQEICFRNFKDAKTNVIREVLSDWLMQARFRRERREKRACAANVNAANMTSD